MHHLALPGHGAEELKRFLTACGVKVEVHEHVPDFDAESILAYAEDPRRMTVAGVNARAVERP